MLAAAMMSAGMVGFGQIAQSLATKSANEIQATNKRNMRRERLPFVSPTGGGNPYIYKEPGLTPKAYGQAFGNGRSRNKKSNMLAISKRTRQRHRRASNT